MVVLWIFAVELAIGLRRFVYGKAAEKWRIIFPPSSSRKHFEVSKVRIKRLQPNYDINTPFFGLI